jgi:hypothetical protein
MTKRLEISLAVIGIILAFITLLFGDNIYEKITGRSFYARAKPLFVSEEPAGNNSQPTPVPPVLGSIIFDENFDNNNNLWATGNDTYTAYIDDGEYHTIGGWWHSVEKLQNIGDFYLETKVRRVEGNDDVGVYFRQSESINYIFVINPENQTYALLVVDMPTDKYTPLMPWVYSPRILSETNTIGIHCKGSTITIYINGHRIDSIQDNSSLMGTIGIDASAKMHSAFDYFRVWTLK